MEANTIFNDRDGFTLTWVDEEIVAAHGTQLAAHVLVDRQGIVRWSSVEAERGLSDIGRFPTPTRS
jgi:hypothetical protein